MGWMTNLKTRRKLFLALSPLVVMVILATLYASTQSKKIDTSYSDLIDRDVKTLGSLSIARAHANRIGFFLYEEINEPNPDKRVQIDGELDKIYADFEGRIADALRQSPERAPEIRAFSVLFDKAESDVRPVRIAALAGNSEKALNLLRGEVATDLARVRQSAIDLVDELQRSVNQQSDGLTAKTHHAIVITWLVIGLGLAVSWATAAFIVESQVVRKLLSMRVSIEDLAHGRLDKVIPCLEQTDEIGAMSRALSTLRDGAREREIQHWVKSEVSGTMERLQAVEDFAAFSNRLFSCLSGSIPLLYGALYVTDESHARVARVGGFALSTPDEALEFGLGEGLVGQAAVERGLWSSRQTRVIKSLF